MSDDISNLTTRLNAFVDAIVREAQSNHGFARRLEDALAASSDLDGPSVAKRFRRRPPTIDPFVLYQKGEGELLETLQRLDIERLKDIIAHNGMDRAKLAMRWKTKPRLVSLIRDTVKTRAHKGEAFMR